MAFRVLAASERLRMETDLRQALARGEFSVHFQPQVDARDNRIIGAETLVRLDGNKCLVAVASSVFEGLRPVKKQQLVYGCLNDLIASGELHAVTVDDGATTTTAFTSWPSEKCLRRSVPRSVPVSAAGIRSVRRTVASTLVAGTWEDSLRIGGSFVGALIVSLLLLS